MRDRFLAAWRTTAQALFALLLTWGANHGLHIDQHWSAPVEIALIGSGAGAWAVLVHWLQSTKGNRWWARLARFAGRVLVLGAKALPSYTTPAASP